MEIQLFCDEKVVFVGSAFCWLQGSSKFTWKNEILFSEMTFQQAVGYMSHCFLENPLQRELKFCTHYKLIQMPMPPSTVGMRSWQD